MRYQKITKLKLPKDFVIQKSWKRRLFLQNLIFVVSLGSNILWLMVPPKSCKQKMS